MESDSESRAPLWPHGRWPALTSPAQFRPGHRGPVSGPCPPRLGDQLQRGLRATGCSLQLRLTEAQAQSPTSLHGAAPHRPAAAGGSGQAASGVWGHTTPGLAPWRRRAAARATFMPTLPGRWAWLVRCQGRGTDFHVKGGGYTCAQPGRRGAAWEPAVTAWERSPALAQPVPGILPNSAIPQLECS